MTTSVHSTACPLDCPDSCSLDVTVDDGRVVKLDGNHVNPLTSGFICSKVRGFHRHLYGEHRLLHPKVRVGPKGSGEFRRVSWDEALDRVASEMARVRDQHGGEAILPFSYGGSNGLVSQDTTDARLFRRLGAARLARTVCAAATSRAVQGLYGKMTGVAFDDYRHAELIVVWGANPSASGIHLVPLIRDAQKAGVKLMVVDPRRTPLAKAADLHLPLRPGTDLPLALALIHQLFERGEADLGFLREHATGADELRRRASRWELDRAAATCGLELADVETFLRLYAESSPAVIRVGWGQERNRNGGSATAAILALPAVAGKLGVRGGGYTASNSAAWKGFDKDAVIGEPETETRIVNMNRLGRELLAEDPTTRLLFVYNANPAVTLPRQDLVLRGLAREDLFTVVFEQVMTDTAKYADVLLPATAFPEHHDLRGSYGAYAFQILRPVADAAGESRPNAEVFEDLVHRLGLDRGGDVPADAIPEALLAQDALDDDQRSELRASGHTAPSFGRNPVQFVDVFPKTPDRKVHLVPPDLDAEAPGGLYGYADDREEPAAPLTLISPATSKTISSTLGQLSNKPARLDLHPEDAARRGIHSGDTVKIWNEFGAIRVKARVTEEVRTGVVSLAKGLWLHNTEGGATASLFAPDTYTDLGGGACFNDAKVEVAKA